MAEYIEREKIWPALNVACVPYNRARAKAIESIPAADVVEEYNILKFYYVRSIGEYWIGRRIDNFYYAEYDPKSRQWVWTHSRYLPWGEHVVSPTSLWKEHTYPSEPEEIPFEEWLQGFIKKYAANARPVVQRDAVNADSWKTAFEVERDEHRWIPVTERLPECDLGAEVGNIE